MKFRGREFSCRAEIEGREWITDVRGTFSADGKALESLTIRHHSKWVHQRVYDAEALEAIDGREHVVDYTITLQGVRRGTVDDGLWPFSLSTELPQPMSMPYSVERREFSAHSGEPMSTGWTCAKARIQKVWVQLVFQR